jgi:predicted Na+-dependent transporter
MDNMLQISQVIANVGILTFVVSSMAALGLGLTVGQIVQPLRNGRLVFMALLANFVLTPLLALVLTVAIPMDEGYKIGLILLATAAGAPFLPKLVQVAKGAVALSVGVMVLLMIVTVIYVPLVLPLLLPGVTVNPLDIAGSLVVLMLIPLAIGLFIKSRYGDLASSLQPKMAQISNMGLMLGFVAGLALAAGRYWQRRHSGGCAVDCGRLSNWLATGWQSAPGAACVRAGHRAAQHFGRVGSGRWQFQRPRRTGNVHGRRADHADWPNDHRW